MELLYLFESIRTPFLDAVMSVITYLGSEVLFMAAAIILFWCVDKRDGYYMLSVGFIGAVVNQFLKLWFRIPRPWVKDPDFTIVESARVDATGYSFPSGHTQTVFATLGVPAMTAKKLWLKIVLFAFLVLTAISRMYLGVHTPLDVGVSFVLGLVLLLAVYPVFHGAEEKPGRVYALLGGTVLLSLAYVLFAELYPFPADVDAENLSHGIKNAYTLLGAGTGLLVSFYLDSRYIHFETKATLWAQLVKIAAGVAGVMVIRLLLKAPLSALFGGHYAADSVRYFLMVLFAGGIWPLTFKWFSERKPLFKKK